MDFKNTLKGAIIMAGSIAAATVASEVVGKTLNELLAKTGSPKKIVVFTARR